MSARLVSDWCYSNSLTTTVADAFRWLPLSRARFRTRPRSIYARLPQRNLFRACGCITFAIATENGFRDIYSNDTKLLALLRISGSAAVNVID